MRSNNRKRISRSRKRGGSPGSSRVNSFVPSCNTQADTFEQFFPKGTANVAQSTYYKTSGGGKHKQLGGNLPYNRIFSQLSSCLDNDVNSSYDNAPADLHGDLGTNYFTANGQNGGRRRRRRNSKRSKKRSSKKRSSKKRGGGSCGSRKQVGSGYGGNGGNGRLNYSMVGSGSCVGNHNKQVGGRCGAMRKQNGGK